MTSYFPLVYYSTFSPFDQHKAISLAAVEGDLSNLYNGTYYGVSNAVYPPASEHSGFQNVSQERKLLYANSGGIAPAVGQSVFVAQNDFQNFIPAFNNAARDINVVVAPLGENGTETVLTINTGVITAINTFSFTKPVRKIKDLINNY